MAELDREALDRIDSYPFRHRVADLMVTPLVTAAAGAELREVAELLRRGRTSALVVDPEGVHGGPGILTERDLVHLLAERGEAALRVTAGEAMSKPIVGVPANAYLFVAIGRMARLKLRHLVAEDENGRPCGMLTARTLLRQRASTALVLGDEVAAAADAAGLKRVQDRMLDLAQSLLAEQVAAPDVAAVISAVLRDISARAAELAAAPLGPPPAPWAYLVLGSGGRGESLLSADQDNAIVHGGTASDDDWYAKVGEEASAILDAAGIPFCEGGIMAARPAWRHGLEDWCRTVDSWTARAEGENLLAVDIFYDFRVAHGDVALAERLRAHAMEAARRPMLTRMMVQELEGKAAPIGLFGNIRTGEGDRLDLKLHGLFPLVAGVRAMALKKGVAATSTAARLEAVAELGVIAEDDRSGLLEARELFMSLILEQQIADMRAGGTPGTKVEIGRLSRPRKRRLKEALRRAAAIAVTSRDVVAHSD